MSRFAQYVLPIAYVFGIAPLRLLPHPPNLVPRLWRYAVPMLAVLFTDIVRGKSLSFVTAFTYIGYALIVHIGRLLSSEKKAGRLLPTSLCGSLVFFAAGAARRSAVGEDYGFLRGLTPIRHGG